jgi:chromosome segregation ATPase
MKTNEIIRNLQALPDYFEIGEPVSFNNLMAIKKESAEIIDLLKSLETTIKDYEVAYTKAVLEKDKLRNELEKYKWMWEELPNKLEPVVLNDCLTELSRAMDVLKGKYLGGGK